MKVLLSIVLVVINFLGIAQNSIGYKGYPSLIWAKLYAIQYTQSKDELGEYEKPLFSNEVKALEGKVITLPGYIVPFETSKIKSNEFILTSLPLNACFFCGVGGPETVIEVNLKKPISYTDKLVEVKGVLRLNNCNPDKMIYRLDQAEYLGEIDF